jgi:hypothetical protein
VLAYTGPATVKINPFFLNFETICMLKYGVVGRRDRRHDLTS